MRVTTRDGDVFEIRAHPHTPGVANVWISSVDSGSSPTRVSVDTAAARQLASALRWASGPSMIGGSLHGDKYEDDHRRAEHHREQEHSDLL